MTEANTKDAQYVSKIHSLPKMKLAAIKTRVIEAQDAAKDTAKVNAYLSLFHSLMVEESSPRLEYFAMEKAGEITAVATLLTGREDACVDGIITVYALHATGERFIAAAALLDTVEAEASLRNMASLDIDAALLKSRGRNSQKLAKRLIKAANEVTLFNNWECCE
jgi:hypothetical protein